MSTRPQVSKPVVLLVLFLCTSLVLLSWQLYVTKKELEVTRGRLLEGNESFNILKKVIMSSLYDICGSFMRLRGNASGFFHVEKIGGAWWFVDPLGNAFISKGVNHVNFGGDYAPSLGYSPYNRAVSSKYGNVQAWAKATVER
ncbi:MAG: hypothetical protein ACUVQY_10245, partial [Thermoproteota archaeon]